MNNLIKYFNENPGVGIILGIVATLIAIIGLFIKKEKYNIHKNSPHIRAGGHIVSGGNINVGNFTHTITADIPEFHLQLYGTGSKRTIEGHAEKQDSRTLVIEYVTIDGLKTDLNLNFTKLTYLKNLNFPQSLFLEKKGNIEVNVIYKTLNGERYKLSQSMIQTNRADGLFNIGLTGSPSIKELSEK